MVVYISHSRQNGGAAFKLGEAGAGAVEGLGDLSWPTITEIAKAVVAAMPV
jgi:hypothetical protein